MLTKTTISNAGNVIVPAYLTLVQKGYSVKVKQDGKRENWIAENERCKLIADDPVTLLGIARVFETRGKSWQASDKEINQFFEKYAQPDDL